MEVINVENDRKTLAGQLYYENDKQWCLPTGSRLLQFVSRSAANAIQNSTIKPTITSADAKVSPGDSLVAEGTTRDIVIGGGS